MFTLTVSSHYIHANRQLVSPPAEPRRALWLLPRISKPFELIVFHLLVTSWLFAWGFNVALRKKHNDLMFREKTLILKICVRSAQTYCWTRAERSAGVHRKRKKKDRREVFVNGLLTRRRGCRTRRRCGLVWNTGRRGTGRAPGPSTRRLSTSDHTPFAADLWRERK